MFFFKNYELFDGRCTHKLIHNISVFNVTQPKVMQSIFYNGVVLSFVAFYKNKIQIFPTLSSIYVQQNNNNP